MSETTDIETGIPLLVGDQVAQYGALCQADGLELAADITDNYSIPVSVALQGAQTVEAVQYVLGELAEHLRHQGEQRRRGTT